MTNVVSAPTGDSESLVSVETDDHAVLSPNVICVLRATTDRQSNRVGFKLHLIGCGKACTLAFEKTLGLGAVLRHCTRPDRLASRIAAHARIALCSAHPDPDIIAFLQIGCFLTEARSTYHLLEGVITKPAEDPEDCFVTEEELQQEQEALYDSVAAA